MSACIKIASLEEQHSPIEETKASVPKQAAFTTSQPSTVAAAVHPLAPKQAASPKRSKRIMEKKVSKSGTVSTKVRAVSPMHPIPAPNCFKTRQIYAARSDAQYLGMMKYLGLAK
jgi:hypothetical protein